jgi:uncharacterized protein YndB with AHSA1/START domain
LRITYLIADPGIQEVVVTHIFDAPRELVFRVYSEPNLIPLWWGPRYMKTTVDKMDFRPGGSWRFIQSDGFGNVYPYHGVYHEIAPPLRLVYTFEFESMPGNISLETGNFEQLNDQTRVTNKSIFQSIADRDGMILSGVDDDITESYDRFVEVLNKIAPV